MGKTRDLFKTIRATKGTFHAKMGSIKGRNGRDLSELVAVTDSSVSLMGYLMFFWLLEGDGSVDHRSARSASDEHNGCCPHIKVPSTQKNYAKKIFMTQKTTMV